jgi:tRNA G10  N-methylase Trm11
MQRYKTVYFADIPAKSSNKKSLTLAFGKRSRELFEEVKGLSSVELRQLLGADNYTDLLRMAEDSDLRLNTYCVKALKRSLEIEKEKGPQLPLRGSENTTILFDPIIVTFKGGAKQPFIRWYPFLEGYSPKFVDEIIESYVPNASCILDPFAGTGTTAFAASERGIRSYFCEVNPVLQFITQIKLGIKELSSFKRSDLACKLSQVRNNLDEIESCEPDFYLDKAYKNVFGKSLFFQPMVYEKILKARRLINDISLENGLLANLVTVAVLSSLVPSSNMKRAGDLRYKTNKEKAAGQIDFILQLQTKLDEIIEDIQGEIDNRPTAKPIFVCEEAHNLSKIPYLGIDTVITSPPYVNGTNYFRNTKIELWFLRCLVEKDDLRRFRSASITSGINDVSFEKTSEDLHSDVERVVRELEGKAYDTRIPKMIATYFSEVTDVFRAIKEHLKKRATIVVDIGDSCYASVHVPVDDLLSSCLGSIGFKLAKQVTLRRRKSRGGMILRQSLLVFDYITTETIRRQPKTDKRWEQRWGMFKKQLPHQTRPFSKRNWGHSWHSLCSYPGKLKPAIAYQLVETFVPKRGRVLDPFVGVGTITLEAALQGKMSYGFEINPAAYVIAKAKVEKPDKGSCLEVIDNLRAYIRKYKVKKSELQETYEFGFNGKINDYFERETLQEVILARRYFKFHKAENASEAFVLACLLHILHGNRPYALSRKSHPITPYKPTGAFEYKGLIEHLRAKVARSLYEMIPFDFQVGKIFYQDATKWWPTEVDDLDAVITSPPFFESTRFYSANWLRLWFAGWDARDFRHRPKEFLEEQQKQSFSVYTPILRQARERLKKNGVVVLHLGKSEKCNMAEELRETAGKWFDHSEIFNESVEHCESHGIRDKGTVTSHQYLILW